VATACVTPAYLHGHFVGAFGSSIKLTSFLNNALTGALPGATNLIVRADGTLIAYPGFAVPGVAPDQVVAGYQKQLGLKALARQAAAKGPYGVLVSPDRKHIVAYGKLAGPNWYLFLSYPASQLTWSAFKSAAWLLAVGLVASLLQMAVILHLARTKIVKPLQDLAESCRPGARHLGAGELERRGDEIGVLARSLRTERDRGDGLLASLEQRVLERTAELEQTNEELERANAEKSRFLANMSHELRTPLNGVIAISETLAQEQVTPRNVELAQLIVSSGRLLEQVLTDILDFSKIEAGEMRMEHAPFDLTAVVSRVARLHQASAEAKGVELRWWVDPLAAGAYLGDQVRLTQVMSNLLSNAVKFTERGTVTARAEAVEHGIRFSVTDSGIGFDDEVKARLFQRFEQADASIRRRFGGTGLGLAICRSLVELMGGEISATSEPGKGSTFSFLLPLDHAQAAATPAAAAAAPEEDIGGLRILLAEDHPTNQRVVTLILESVGVDLTIVENGALALEALERDRFDVVLMDMQMPELDGLSATAMMREREAARGLPRTPVIMLTANALDEHVRASLDAGADRHLAKPLRPAELLDAIATVIQPQAPDEAHAGVEAA
jgi:signal transduction histidine kinase/CheY-like chemotaxis protein